MANTEIKTFKVSSTIEETTREINKWAKDNGMLIHQIMPIAEGSNQHIMVVYSKEYLFNF